MPIPVVLLASLGAMPALAYTFVLLYFFIVGDISDRAGAAGQFGVVVGMVGIAGISAARHFWDELEGVPSALRASFAVGTICMVVLVAIMRWTGDFGEEVFKQYVPLFDLGVVLGATAGGSIVLLLLLDGRRSKSHQAAKP